MKPMTNVEDLPPNTHVMVPLGDVLHRGIIVKPTKDHSLGKGMIRVKFTPSVPIEPSGSIDYMTRPARNVTLGWF
jgi:hypothetical protein